jgi:hypothetical protein
VRHGQQAGGLHRGQATLGGEVDQVAIPLRDVVVGPEEGDLRLFLRPGRAVRAAQPLHLLEVGCVFVAPERRGAIGPELGSGLQGQRHDQGELRSDRCGARGRLVDPGTGCGLDIGDRVVQAIDRRKIQEPGADLLAGRDAVHLRLALRNGGQARGIRHLEVVLLVGEEVDQHAMRGGGDGRVQRSAGGDDR